MPNILIALLAILPGLLICYWIYRFDKHEKESRIALWICFGLGIVSALPALKLEEWWDQMGVNEHGSFAMLLLLSFVVIALSEELVKFIVLVVYPFPKKFFNEPLDGIVYSVMIGMGFATIENIIYADRFGTATTIVRAFTAVPAHAVFAVAMGYFVGLAKFNKKNRIKNLAFGLGLAILIHGIYDVFILQQYYDWLMIFATFTLLVSGYFAYRLISKHQRNSPFIIQNQEQQKTQIDISAIDVNQVILEKSDDDIMNAIISDLEEE